MVTHPNDMSAWDEIACQRGHSDADHAAMVAPTVVDLSGGPHGYHDLPQVPKWLVPPPFAMNLWTGPVDGGPYCPAHDAVSETILSHGIWEPRETILAAQVFSTATPAQVFLDFGAQIGWYVHLAHAFGVQAAAIEADDANLRLIGNAIPDEPDRPALALIRDRIGSESNVPPLVESRAPIRLAKIDVEGAEPDAVRVLWPAITAGTVDHLLIEVSPVFHDGYPDLVRDLMGEGFACFGMPPKQRPPVTFATFPDDLLPYQRFSPTEIDPHQEDLWFWRMDASW